MDDGNLGSNFLLYCASDEDSRCYVYTRDTQGHHGLFVNEIHLLGDVYNATLGSLHWLEHARVNYTTM